MNVAQIGERRWEAVAWSMAAGAAYDAVFALAILLARRPAAEWLAVPLPEDSVYLELCGVLLLLLAGLYALPAARPRRYQGVVAVAAAGRALGFVFLARAWWRAGVATFGLLALADLGFAAAHALLLLRARRGASA